MTSFGIGRGFQLQRLIISPVNNRNRNNLVHFQLSAVQWLLWFVVAYCFHVPHEFVLVSHIQVGSENEILFLHL